MKREVVITQTVEVEVDLSKFTPEFMAEFRRDFYEFYTVDQHVEYLGGLYARGFVREFIEGYGPAADMGIKFKEIEINSEVQP